MFWVGILLIVSAGSFIYVATLHILPEVMNNDSHNKESKSNLKPSKYRKIIEIGCMVIGLIAPLGLTFLEDE
jgi:zinc transporter ZupT